MDKQFRQHDVSSRAAGIYLKKTGKPDRECLGVNTYLKNDKLSGLI